MGEFRAAHRYALALFGAAVDSNQLNLVGRDFERIESLISSSREFALFLRSPVISPVKKQKIVEELLRGRIGDITLTFVRLLVSRSREGILSQIIAEFSRLRDERMGVVNAAASVAVPLTPAQEKRLVEALEGATKKTVRMKVVQDPALKGGFTVRVEDTVWDASVRHELEQIRKLLVAGAAS